MFRHGDWEVVVGATIGVFGYAAGTDKMIVDRMALSDPLLSRLPASPPWRVGHYAREVPDGYLAYLTGVSDARLPNARLQHLAEDMALITRSKDLFARERWQAIWRQNHF